MNSTQKWPIRLWARQCAAVALSLVLLVFVQGQLNAQDYPPGAYAALDAEQLDQLVAPIALYPDSLVSQMVAASTYPQQIADAWNWMAQNGGMPPGQRAEAINSMPWDPSVKAVAEFPSALEYMGRNPGWTGALGNAYYNQPSDVMNAVQAMRYRAREAGTLRSTAYERVYLNGPEIDIAPVNPDLVYVPYYNPWGVYGAPVPAWGGFYLLPTPRGVIWGTGIAIGFAAAISIGLYAHYGWGWHSWSPNWRSGRVYYNHATYFSRSNTVYNHGHFGGYNRGVYEHEGRGVPGGFHASGHEGHAEYTHAGPQGAHHAGPSGAYHAGPSGAYHAGPSGAYHAGPTGAYHPESTGGYHAGSTGAYNHGSTPAHNSYHSSPVTAHGNSHVGSLSGTGAVGHTAPSTVHTGGGPIHGAVAHVPTGAGGHVGSPSGTGGGGHTAPPTVHAGGSPINTAVTHAPTGASSHASPPQHAAEAGHGHH